MFIRPSILRVLISLVFVVGSSLSFAAQNAIETQIGKKKRKLSLHTFWSSETSLHETKGVDYQAASRLTFVPGYSIDGKYKVSAIGGATITHTSPEELTMNNTKIRLSHKPLTINHDLKWVPIVGVVAPTNEIDRIKNSFQAAIVFEPLLLGKFSLLDQNFDFTYRPRLTKNFHEFDRTALLAANTSYSLSQLAALSYNFTDKFFMDLDFTYAMGRTYQGAFRSSFLMGQSLSYVYNPGLILSLGHSNSGNALNANGVDNEIKPFDKDKSSVYFQLRWSI